MGGLPIFQVSDQRVSWSILGCWSFFAHTPWANSPSFLLKNRLQNWFFGLKFVCDIKYQALFTFMKSIGVKYGCHLTLIVFWENLSFSQNIEKFFQIHKNSIFVKFRIICRKCRASGVKNLQFLNEKYLRLSPLIF